MTGIERMYKLGIIICIITFLSFLNANAQLPNANFEDWATAANGTDSLIGWHYGFKIWDKTKSFEPFYKGDG